MKTAALLFAAFVPAAAHATDFRACAPITYPKQTPEYTLTATGHLAFKAKDAVRSETGVDGDRVVTVYDPKQKQFRHQELRFENGRPVALKSYIGVGDGYAGDVTTRHFAYEDGRCYVKDITVDSADHTGAVTYDRAFCAKLLATAEGMTERPADVQRVGKLLVTFDHQLKQNDHQLFGFNETKLKGAGAADMIASVVGNCRAIGAAYPDVKVSEKTATRVRPRDNEATLDSSGAQ